MHVFHHPLYICLDSVFLLIAYFFCILFYLLLLPIYFNSLLFLPCPSICLCFFIFLFLFYSICFFRVFLILLFFVCLFTAVWFYLVFPFTLLLRLLHPFLFSPTIFSLSFSLVAHFPCFLSCFPVRMLLFFIHRPSQSPDLEGPNTGRVNDLPKPHTVSLSLYIYCFLDLSPCHVKRFLSMH